MAAAAGKACRAIASCFGSQAISSNMRAQPLAGRQPVTGKAGVDPPHVVVHHAVMCGPRPLRCWPVGSRISAFKQGQPVAERKVVGMGGMVDGLIG
jgi:hypothetical protein